MIGAIAWFEVRYQLRRPLLWLIVGVFFLLTFGAASSDSIRIGGAVGNVYRNAPLVIVQWLDIMSVFGLLFTTVFVAGAILRDFDGNTHELFFSRPVRRVDYLLGRLIGGFLISVVAFMGSVVGLLVGYLMPWLDPERLGPFMAWPYFWALVVLALPNLLFCAAVFFSLASLTRSMLATYLGVVGFFAAYAISGTLLQDLDSDYLAALLDPFAMGALQLATRYWTIVESNTIVPELTGVLVHNRLLWLGVAGLILAAALSRFRYAPASRRGKRPVAAQEEDLGVLPGSGSPALPRLDRSFEVATAWRQFGRQTGVELRAVFRGVAFLVLLALGLFNLIASTFFVDRLFGTLVHPVTHLMVETIEGSFAVLLVIIVTFYSGELIWRERSVRLNEVFDAMPVPNWVYLAAKLVAQALVVIAFLAIGVLATIGVQIYHGYYRFELPVYAQGTLILALYFILTCFLASFFQVATGKKFVGYLLMVLFLVSSMVLATLDFDHHLYQYGEAPSAQYSDMNGYGHFVAPLVWFNLYWAFVAVILVGLSVLLWVRGNDTGLKARLRIAGQRCRGPVRVALAVGVVGFLATGAWIFYNTNVLNEYLPGDEAEARAADYEKKFRQYRDVDLPRITDVRVDVDIFPHQRRVEARGRYRCLNRNPRPLTELHLTIPREVTVNALDLPAHTETLHDAEHGYRIYRLNQALAPGEEMELGFDLTVENPGFRNHNSNTTIVYNGTFFNNRHYFPSFGYDEDRQLVDRNERRRHDLPPVHRFAKVDDLFARRNTYISSDSDWVNFETTVSTSADQVAIAPGYLQKEWTAGDRRYFHYQMDAPILHFYSYLSAAYQVRRDHWRDVLIEVYYHEPHDFNLDRMIESVKKSLACFAENFGPYQHRQVRIIEFPRYASFAQSFPNTVPFSEAIGFIAKLDDDEDAIDYPFYVAAHEVAHQWWAHQVIGGNVQGMTLMSETLAQYSALMVMEREYGQEKMRRFLKYELDNYLRNRSQELVEEMPLYLVENQPYIHYHKGSVVMYALRDYVGEGPLNQALAAYTAAFKFQPPPYTNSPEFLNYLREVVPPAQQRLIVDLFETITLFENRVEEASFVARDDGKFVVALEARARKVRADGQGVETEIPLDDWIDVGVFGEREVDGKTEPTVLYLEKRHVTAPEVSFEVVVDERPVRAGIDPYNKLVDRNSGDNLRRLSETSVEEIGVGAAGG